ncbi:MAG: tetratricopeptide repeat protein [Verrucomicrobiota bacterium]
MRKEHPPTNPPPTSVIATQWAILIAIVAFCAGFGISWLIFHEPPSKTTAQPPAFPTSVTSPAGGNSELVPPDVSQMSPAESSLALGNWYYDQSAWHKAIEAYQRAISLGLDNPDVRTDLGNALRFSGEPQKALEQYQTARRQNPQHENSLCNMATLYAQVLKNPVNADTAWREYLRLFPNGSKASAAKQFIATESQNLP